MGSLRRRNAVMEAVGMSMLEAGKVLSKTEYDNLPGAPVRSAIVLNHFGNWNRLIGFMRKNMPHVFEEIEKPKKRAVTTDTVKITSADWKNNTTPTSVEPKKDPLAALRSKPAEQTETENEGLQE